MSERNLNREFAEMVELRLTPNARELWGPMAQEFLAKGPEAVKRYLEDQRQAHQAYINNQLKDFEDR